MSGNAEIIEERTPQHGDFVTVKLTGWLGQVVDFKQEGYNEPQYFLRVWTGSVLFREWFSECELDALPDEPNNDGGENVIPVDFTKRVKLDKDTPTGGAA